MKKLLLALLIIAVAAGVTVAKDKDKAKAKAKAKIEAKDDATVDALKFFLSKQADYVMMLRAYQYTVTDEKNNSYSYVVTDKSGQAAKEAGLTKKDKGKFAGAFANRDGARIAQLWAENKDALMALLPKAKYEELLKYDVDAAVTYRESANYKTHMAALVKACPKPSQEVSDKAGEICNWENYKQLTFWYRRTMEKNDEATLQVLKDIQAFYK
ncbi:MAG: hypothetical protein EPN93_11340 [Spirochaetes bacterium]|nr:MAG: hypothetical protein EPN93_11340 [Spirochaetota bacterium]